MMRSFPAVLGSLVCLCTVAILLLLPGHLASATETISQTISVRKGIERFLPLEHPVRRLSIGDPGIADISIMDGKTLRILGLSDGETTFSLWRENDSSPRSYTVVVAPDLDTLQETFSADPDLKGARVSLAGGKLVLKGDFENDLAQTEARKIAKYVTGLDPLDLSHVVSPEAVQVDVEVITVSKVALSALGLNFSSLGKGFSVVTTPPNTLSSYGLNGASTGLQVSTATPIANAFNLLLASPRYNTLAVISALQSSNFAETLVQPSLLVHSGEKANFLVGGEIPIPVPQGNAANAITIQYKRFGVSLDVEPQILKGRRISLRIKPSVSELDYTNAITLDGFTVPALKTRETETTVEVGADQPLVLAGLNFDAGTIAHEKVPYLADIPVLGEFFRRRNETREEQELIIAVTPRIVSADTQDRSAQVRIHHDFMDLSSRNGAVPALPERARDSQPEP